MDIQNDNNYINETIDNTRYIIRHMNINDCEGSNELFAELKWEIGKYEHFVMLNAKPEGFFVAQEIGTSKIIGMGVAVNHTESFAVIGRYGVHPKYQGKGIGQKIWKKLTEHIGPERNISLFAMPKMFTIYRDKCNFIHIPVRLNTRYGGLANCDKLIKHIDNITVVKVNEENLKNVIAYDKSICEGISRDTFLEGFTKVPETVFLMAKDNYEEIKGYCIMSTSIMNTALPQPLYADSKEIAELLIGKCCKMMPIAVTNGIFMKTFDCNKFATELAIKMGLKLRISEHILFNKNMVNGNLEKIYCLSNTGYYPF